MSDNKDIDKFDHRVFDLLDQYWYNPTYTQDMFVEDLNKIMPPTCTETERKFSFLLDDYESERLAHEQTKKNSDITVQALLIEQEAHEATRKELEELQDAIAMRARQRVTMGNNSKEYHLTLNLIYPGQGLKDEILIDAIQASRERASA
jgi:hypothetical protein